MDKPRLIDFEPRWIDTEDRKGLGVVFSCATKHCPGHVWVLFANPLDGGEAYPGDCWSLIWDQLDEQRRAGRIYDRPCGTFRWKRKGETFDTLTLEPSVNAHACGHFTLDKGEMTWA